MQKSYQLMFYFAAPIAVAAVVGVCAATHFGQHDVRSEGTQPMPAATLSQHGNPRSYEDTVRDQQRQWGHGHTLADPDPAEAAPQTRRTASPP